MASVTFMPICHFPKGPAGAEGEKTDSRGARKHPPKKGRRDRWATGRADGSEASQVTSKASGDPTSQRETCSQPDAAGERSSCLLWRDLSHDVSSSEVEALYGTFQVLGWVLEKLSPFPLAHSR